MPERTTGPTMLAIVKEYIILNKLAGLCNPEIGCACGIDELMICEQPGLECLTAFDHGKFYCPSERICKDCSNDCEFYCVP